MIYGEEKGRKKVKRIQDNGSDEGTQDIKRRGAG